MYIFINFSQKALHEAHPSFSEQERRSLHKRWYRLQPKAFLLLEHLENNNTKRVIAISIVLPLPEHSSGIKHLLIDTWIICPKYRHKYIEYEYSLILKHISYFWKPFDYEKVSENPVEILVEPDVWSVKRMLMKLDFKLCDQQENIYKLSFPVATADDGTSRSISRLLIDNFRHSFPLR